MKKENVTTNVEKEEKKKEYNIIFYTDGSGLLEYRTWGCGFIGYSYDINNIKPDKSFLKKLNPTEIGFVNKEMILEDESYGKAKPVSIDKLYYGYKTGNVDNTNNYAEALSTYEVLKIAKEELDNGELIKNIIIKTDSQMVVMVYLDMQNNPNFNYNRFAYPDLYKTIYELFMEFKENGINVIVTHVNGHGSSYGNHLADRLAYIGRNNHTNRKIKGTTVSDGITIKEKIDTLDKEYEKEWSGSIIDLPFLRSFLLEGDDNKKKFFIMEYPNDAAELGKRNPDITYGYIEEELEDKVLERISKTEQFEDFKDEYYHFMLKNIKTPIVYLLSKLDDTIFTKKGKKAIRLADDIDLVIKTEPSGLIRQQLDRFTKTDTVLGIYKRYLRKEKQITLSDIVDVTNLIYTENNGKYKLIPTIKDKDFKVKTTIGIEIEHTVKYKTFIPNISYFKSLLKRDIESLKCYFVTKLVSEYKVNDKTTYIFDDYLIVDLKDKNNKQHLAIWCNFYSGRTLVIA